MKKTIKSLICLFVSLGIIGLGGAVCLGESLAPAVAKGASPHPEATARGGGPELADRDGDGLSDGLQMKLAEMHPSDPVEVLVNFYGPGDHASAQRAVGPFQLKREFKIIPGFSAEMTAAQVRALARVPGVFRVEENFQVSMVMDVADRDFGAEAVRTDLGLTGRDIGICIVDTGVDPNHEQLDNGKVEGFIDLVNGRTSAYDDHGHGTHVASIAAGDRRGGSSAHLYGGVAPDALVFAAKVLNSSGTGTASSIIAGIEWCASQPEVKILSMSLGTAQPSDGSDSLSQAVNEAVTTRGKIVVVAAGNSGDGISTIGAPGAAAKAITVGAVSEWSESALLENRSHGIYLAPFSSRGPIEGATYTYIKPDIVAPGVTIRAARAGTVNGYVTYSGTSMATPFVSGAIALALQGDDSLTPVLLKERLQSSAHSCGPDGKDSDYGAGLVDVYALAGGNGATPFPYREGRTVGTVPNNGTWEHSFEVTDLDAPVAVTLTTLSGAPSCSLWLAPGWCWVEEWSPDLDAVLLGPAGTELTKSTCMNGTLCAGLGRQETLHWRPIVTGTYTVRVYAVQDSVNNGKGGDVALDISRGPVAASAAPADALPTVTITSPANGSLVSGTILIQLQASDAETTPENLLVETRVDNGAWSEANYNPEALRYDYFWDTTAFSDGSHQVSARATDSASQVSSIDTVGVTVKNEVALPSTGVHVGNLTGEWVNQKNLWQALVSVTVHDGAHKVQSGAAVSGNWSDGNSGACTTGQDGTCIFQSKDLAKKVKSISFEVTGISSSADYDPSTNEVNPPSITISKP